MKIGKKSFSQIFKKERHNNLPNVALTFIFDIRT